MDSWTGAFLILKKWRDERTLITVLEPVPQEHGETIVNGPTAFVWRVDSDSGKIWLGLDESELRELDLLGSSLVYSDPRSSGLVDGTWECDIEVTFPNGDSLVLAELPPLPS